MDRVRTAAQLGAAVRARRQQLGWTQAETADRAGVSRATLISFERGNPNGELGVAMRVVAAVGLALCVVDSPPEQSTNVDDLFAELDGGERR